MAKKLTKQEVEQDPLLRTYASIQAFYLKHKNIIIGSAVAVILAIGLAIGYHFYEKSRNNKAEKKMGLAEEYLLRGQYQKALNGSKQNNTIGILQILKKYPGTKAGNLAHYYAAICEYHLGKTQQALTHLNGYNVPDGILGVAPLSFKGVILNDLGKYKKAANAYLKAATWDKNNSTTPYNYYKAAQAFHEAGDLAKAKKYAQLVVNNYPNSNQVTDAQKLLGRISTENK